MFVETAKAVLMEAGDDMSFMEIDGIGIEIILSHVDPHNCTGRHHCKVTKHVQWNPTRDSLSLLMLDVREFEFELVDGHVESLNANAIWANCLLR